MDARKERYTMTELALATLPPGAEKRMVHNRVRAYYGRAKRLGIKPDEQHRYSYEEAIKIITAPGKWRGRNTRREVIDPLKRALQDDGVAIGKR